jgi:cytochrome c
MRRTIWILSAAFLWYGCGGREDAGEAPGHEVKVELTAFELEHGIGPVTEAIDIGEIQMERVARGADFFDSRCASCHRMERRFVGPPLGDIMEKRSKEFVINFILNPEEMVSRHPVGRELLQDYLTIMPYQNVTGEQAIEIVDFLRYYAETGEDVRD